MVLKGLHEVRIMNILRKPVVAWLIAVVMVGASTSYLVVSAPQVRTQRATNEDRMADEDRPVEIENVERLTGYVGEYKGVTFAVLNQLHPVVSDDEEFLWLYGSAGDNSSLIMLQVFDDLPSVANENALYEIFEGMESVDGVSQFAEAEMRPDLDFLNLGRTFEQVVNERTHIGVSYLFVLDEERILGVSYIHYEGQHTDLREDFEFALEHIWLDVDPYEIAVNFSGMLQDQEVSDGFFGDLQEGVVEEIREGIARLAAEYDGDIVIVSNANAAMAPSLSSFIPTPTVIYDTLGSENGFMDTYMVVEGEVTEWFTHENFTHLILTNEEGEIQMAVLEPLVDNPLSTYRSMLPEGTDVRIYYNYSGFSLVLERAAGVLIGFVILDDDDSDSAGESETEEDNASSTDDADVSREFQNALSSARNYLSFMSFSFESLSRQLDFENYSQEAIDWAMEQIDAEVDWYEQAVKSAENYLDFMDFSPSGLVDQLIFEGFTRSQAEHAVEVVY